MTAELLPPFPAIGNAIVEIYGPSPASARWDEATWDGSMWAMLSWQNVTPESMVVKLTWGADDPAGVLTVPAAGSWSIETYDPQRKLDPSNGASPLSSALRPGRPIRASVRQSGKADEVVRLGVIDEIEYDTKEKVGSLRGTDVVPLIVAAKLPAGMTGVPATLRARARYIIDKAGLGKLVRVESGAGATEMVVNGGFETGDLTGWGGYGNRYVELHDTPQGISNICTIATETGVGWPQISSNIMAVIAGKQYVLGVWSRNDGAVSDQRDVRIDATDGTTQAFFSFLSTETEWTYKELTWTAPKDMEVYILAYVGTAGRAFGDETVVPQTAGQFAKFDNFTFKAVMPDPPVGPLPDDKEPSAWSAIATSAFDALYAMWIDRFGTLRFRSFGAPQDDGFTVGGDAGIPLASLKPHASIANVYTSVRAFDDGAPDVAVVKTNPQSAEIYGTIILTREKPVPDAQVWAQAVLDDRAGAGLQYETGTLYPRTYDELMSIINLDMVDIMHVVADDIVPPLNIAARVLGVRLTADTDTGWTAEVLSYIPAREWQEAEQPIPPPIVEPPPETTTPGVVRYYDANKDSRAGRDGGGANLGSGTEGELPVGAWQGWRNRSFIGFPSIPFGDVHSVDKAELELDTSSQVNVGFGSSPKIIVKRVTQAWNEGTSSSPTGSNATKYPGPNVSSNDAKTASITRSENASVVIDITGIARAWFSGSGQYGVGLFSAGEDSTSYTTEFWSRENATSSKRPRLKLTLTVKV